MRILTWLLRGILFVFLLGFAVKNDQLVTLHFFFGNEWNLPLVFVILLFFAAGIVLGAISTSIAWFRQRREVARLKRLLKQSESSPVAASSSHAVVAQPDQGATAPF